jgi:phosphate transport system protein
MREAYRGQLDQLAEELAGMCELTGAAMRQATRALLETDLALAEQVISEDAQVDLARASTDEHAFALLALQAPVAGDLRTVVSAIQASADIERMGGLAVHVAQAARRRHPQPVLPDQVRPHFAEMGRVAVQLAMDAAQVVRTRDVHLAVKVEQDDDAMDDLHKHLFTVLMAPAWPHGVAAAVDVALLGRFYERFADHAVSLARQVVYVVTGQLPNGVNVGQV